MILVTPCDVMDIVNFAKSKINKQTFRYICLILKNMLQCYFLKDTSYPPLVPSIELVRVQPLTPLIKIN